MTFCNSLLDLQKRKGIRGEREEKNTVEEKKGRKKEASSEIFGDIQLSDHDVLLSASPYSEQMLNGLIDRQP